MSQTLVIRTPDAVSTTSRTFPKQGMFNLKITKNGVFDTVELWFRTGTSNITLELAGASFQSTAPVDRPRIMPEAPTYISGTTLALTAGVTHYMKIKLNDGISIAYLRCSYAAKNLSTVKNLNTVVVGGNSTSQAYVDYGKKPYISTSLERLFTTYPVKFDITKWDVSYVTNFSDMFQYNVTFNQPIGNWDVSSNALDISYMFMGASSFNQPISNWDVSNATTMSYMFFKASSFNQPIGNWDVSKAVNMSYMFSWATSFDQDLSSWATKFNVNVNLTGFFADASWSTANYDNFLNTLWLDINNIRPQAWASRTQPKVLGMGNSKYSAASAAARNSLVTNGWTITDGGLA